MDDDHNITEISDIQSDAAEYFTIFTLSTMLP